MKHLLNYNKYQKINEESSDEDSNIQLKFLLLTLFINCLPNYKNKPDYFIADEGLELTKSLRRTLTNKINQMLNKKNVIMRFVKILGNTCTLFSGTLLLNYKQYCCIWLKKNNDLGLTPWEREQPAISVVKTVEHFNPLVDQKLPNVKVVFMNESENMSKRKISSPPYKHQVQDIDLSYQDLLKAYNPKKDNYFNDELFEKVWKYIDEKHLSMWKEVLLNCPFDFYDIVEIRNNYKPLPIDDSHSWSDMPLYLLTQLLDYYIYNKTYFKKMIDLFLKEGDKLPDMMATHLLYRGCDLDLPQQLFSQQFIKNIESKPELLTLCRKNFRLLYDKIKSTRTSDDDWKTDLSAGMGDLGF